MSATSAEEVSPGVFVVHFPTRDAVSREGSLAVIPSLIEASQRRPVFLLADLPDDVVFIPPPMVTAWLDAMVSGGLRVRGIGVATRSRAVRAVANAFQTAMKLRKQTIFAAARPTLSELVAWAIEQSASAHAAAPP